MDFTYTRHQIPRGARADAEVGGKLYLIKNVPELRLTYQIRMLVYMAKSRGKTLIVQLPKGAKVHKTLRDFAREWDGLIKIERV